MPEGRRSKISEHSNPKGRIDLISVNLATSMVISDVGLISLDRIESVTK